MRMGIIGTNWITDRFIHSASNHPNFSIVAVCSRTKEKALEFADKYDLQFIYTNMEEMFKSGNIEAVYIATPNVFHAEQSILAMKHGVHVLCEKPAVTTVKEMKKIMEVANQHQVTFMEALKSTVSPTFLNIKKNLNKVGTLRRLVFHHNQYSSRYNKFRNGIVENAFKPELGNGAHMDLGVYCLAPIIHLVGPPKSVCKNNFLLSTKAEGQGSMILGYDTFEAIIMYSKITDSYLPSEIQGENGTIEIDKIGDPQKAFIKYRNGEEENLSIPHDFGTMFYEFEEFFQCVQNRQTQSKINSHHNTLEMIRLLEYESRR